jgi:RHS repeat-associated protein
LKETIYLPGHQIYRTFRGDGTTIKRETRTSAILEDCEDETGAAVALVEYDSAAKVGIVRYQTTETLELDDQAGVVSYAEYSPYGVNTYNSVGPAIEAPRKYRFAGYERDTETGMYRCGERYYAAWLGRWSSPDPIGLADGVNRYCYVRNDPTDYSDSKGMMRSVRGGEGHDQQSTSRGGRTARFHPYSSPHEPDTPGPGGLAPPSNKAGLSKYIAEEVQRTPNEFQVYPPEGAEDGTAQFHPLGEQPLSVAIRGLIGCTALILVSPKAVYFAHFFEDKGFGIPDDKPNLGEEEMQALFDTHVTHRLQNGTEAFPALQHHVESFPSDKTQAVIMTPTDPTNKKTGTIRGEPTFATRVGELKAIVDKMISMPEPNWTVQLYDPEGARKPGEQDTAAGKALVQYHPGPPGPHVTKSRLKGFKTLRVYLETNMVFER